MNGEVYQNHINQQFNTKFKMPVGYYVALMSWPRASRTPARMAG